MSPPHNQSPCLSDERGFTLIELLVSMLVATVITGAAMSFLIFTTEDVSHITSRVNVDQNGRLVLAKIMSNLDSGCYKPSAAPIQLGSNESTLIFTSESGSASYFSTVEKHEIIFTKATGATEGTLVEKNYTSKPITGEATPEYSTTPTSTVRLLKGIRQTEYGSEKALPIFRYYRYYNEHDPPPQGDTIPPYGEIFPEPIKSSPTVTATEVPYITKVTMSFTLAPEGREAVSFNKDRPVVLEDSTVLRLAPSSESASNRNLPCSEKT